MRLDRINRSFDSVRGFSISRSFLRPCTLPPRSIDRLINHSSRVEQNNSQIVESNCQVRNKTTTVVVNGMEWNGIQQIG